MIEVKLDLAVGQGPVRPTKASACFQLEKLQLSSEARETGKNKSERAVGAKKTELSHKGFEIHRAL